MCGGETLPSPFVGQISTIMMRRHVASFCVKGLRPMPARRGSASADFDATHVPGLWGSYLRLVQHRPLAAAFGVSAVLWVAGDLTAQALEASESHTTELGDTIEKKRFPDLKRLGCTGFEGSMVGGGLSLYWYAALDRFVGTTLGLVGGSVAFVAAKVALECVLWHPFTLTLFWTFMGAVEGNSWEKIRSELAADFAPTLATEYLLWLPIDILNFRFVPVHLQVLVVNAGSLIEAVLLSYIHAHGFPGSEKAPPSQDAIQDSKSRVPALMQNLRPHTVQKAFVIPRTEREAAAAFDAMDVNKSGYVSSAELTRWMKAGGSLLKDEAASECVAQILLRYTSVTDHKRISRDKYLTMIRKFADKEFSAQFLGDVVFALFDKDHDGFLDRGELTAFVEVLYGVENVSAQHLDCVLKEADKNADGKLSLEEVRALVASASD
jgi:protein Mpv17